MTTRVILDCDTRNEIDDQFAIAYALGSADLDVLGVVSVQNTVASGVDSVDLYVEEAERMAALCGRSELPCPAGARSPMESPSAPVASDGVDFIAQHAATAPLTVIATGPITDIASFALLHPELVDRVNVVWLGAFGDETNWQRHRLGELNARADIAAWRALYTGGIRLTLLPGWPHVARVSVDWREYSDRLAGAATAASAYLAEITAEWCSAHERQYAGLRDERMLRAKVLWDVVNVAYLRNPGWLTLEERELPTLDPAGAPDYRRPSRRAEVCVGLEPDAILDDLWNVLTSLPTVGS